MAYVKFVGWFIVCLVTFPAAVTGQVIGVMLVAEWWYMRPSPEPVTAVITAGLVFSLLGVCLAPTLVAAGLIADFWLTYWPAFRDRLRAAIGLPKIYDYVAVLLCLSFASSAANAEPINDAAFDGLYRKLLPEALTAVDDLMAVSPQVKDVIELSFTNGKLPNGAMAIRAANRIIIRRTPEGFDEVEAFNTLTHEIIHMVTAGRTMAFAGEEEILRVQMAFNEAVSWRFATELTAKKFKIPLTPEVYDWQYIPQSKVPTALVVDTVMSDPEIAILIARDKDVARKILDHYSK